MDKNALAKSNLRIAITAILLLEGLPLHFLLSRVHPLLAWGVTGANVLSLILLWWPRANLGTRGGHVYFRHDRFHSPLLLVLSSSGLVGIRRFLYRSREILPSSGFSLRRFL